MGKHPPPREWGDGSVYRLAARDRWQASLDMPAPGTRRRRRVVTCRTQAEAEAALRRLRAERAAGQTTAPLTLARYLPAWLAGPGSGGAPATVARRRYYVDTYLIPELGRIALTALTAQDVRGMIARIAERRTPTTHAPTSASTGETARKVLAAALRDGQAEYGLPLNAARLARLPRPAAPRPERPVLALPDARRLLHAVAGHRWEAILWLALGCGLRQGEILGLRWRDCALDAGTLTITGSLDRITHQRVAPKTNASRRTLALTPPVVAALRAQRARRGTTDPDALVFVTATGAPLDGSTLGRDWRALRDRLGLPPLRFHDLRHEFVTLSAVVGNPMEVTKALAGHSRIAVTADIYTHISSEQRAAMERISAQLADKEGKVG